MFPLRWRQQRARQKTDPTERGEAEPVSSDLKIRSLLQLKFAETIGWTVDRFELDDKGAIIAGWALHPFARPDDLGFVINGKPFLQVEWPLASPDVAALFDALPHAGQCRFFCRYEFGANGMMELIPGDYVWVACVSPFGIHQETYRKALFLLRPDLERAVPEQHRILRTIQGDDFSYRYGGATLVKRLDAYLAKHFGRSLTEFDSVLDWGCEAGRLTRHLVRLCQGAVVGVDIDEDNIAWCARGLPQATFLTGPLRPPLPFGDGAFDH